jgi:Protein of unknown function (DUF1460)
MFKKISFNMFILTLCFGQCSCASEGMQDIWVPGYSDQLAKVTQLNKSYSLLNYEDYQMTVAKSQNDVVNLLALVKAQTKVNRSADKVTNIIQTAGNYLAQVSYGGNEGEGNWCDGDLNKGECMHIQQDPVYRTDTLNCTTLVQLVLGLINSNNLNDFEHNILNIEYGAETNYGHRPEERLAYSNRNNFADGDFNPVNQKSGLLTDVTDAGIFSQYASSITANITRANWFAFQAKPEAISDNVRVFDDKTGVRMAQKFSYGYGSFYQPQVVAIKYIPKFSLVNAKIGQDIEYAPNEYLINQIPTPAVVEIIRDDRQWFINGVNIVDLIGSGTSVSHMGFLYRQHFNKGDTIYQKTYCTLNSQQKKECSVAPVICDKQGGCTKTMMLAATSAYPNGFVWSENKNTGVYDCTDPSLVPAGATVLSACNRVIAMPFGDYITFQYNGNYTYLNSPSIVGFNVQKINAAKK